MSINLDIREQLPDGSIVFDNPSFDESIIGVSLKDEVIYSYERMVSEFMTDNECTEEEALDWIDYNTMRALSYFPNSKPLIMSEV